MAYRPGDLEHIFDKFYRGGKGRSGAGRHRAWASRSRAGFVEAMEGQITAANRTDRPGAVFTITLPVPPPTKQLDTAA